MLHQRVRFSCLLLPLRENATIIERHNLDYLLTVFFPAVQDLFRPRTLRQVGMTSDELLHVLFFIRILDGLQVHHLQIAALHEIARFVENVGDTAAHAGRKISTGSSKHDNPAAGHIFASVIADAFNDGNGTAVADGEPFAGDAANKGFAGCCAI